MNDDTETSQNPEQDDLKDNVSIKVVDYLVIRDVDSGQVILRQRGSKDERSL